MQIDPLLHTIDIYQAKVKGHIEDDNPFNQRQPAAEIGGGTRRIRRRQTFRFGDF